MAREGDRICKEYFDQADRFSDLVNYILYQGREVTKPSDFRELDPVRSEVFGPDNSYEILIDNLKELSLKEDDRNIYVMIGLESQGYHDETMVVRAMKAKALLYTYQLREKVKPLKPVIIIVLNLTGDKWKSPVTLKSMFEKEYLDKFGYLIDDVSYVLLDVNEDSEIPKGLLKTDLELLLNCLKYSSNRPKLEDYIEKEEAFNSLDDITFKLINKISVLDVKIKEEGGKIKMWPAVKQMKEESYNNGYDSGFDSGINKGKLEQSEHLVNIHLLSVEQAARGLNLTVEEYLAAVKNLKK